MAAFEDKDGNPCGSWTGKILETAKDTARMHVADVSLWSDLAKEKEIYVDMRENCSYWRPKDQMTK